MLHGGFHLNGNRQSDDDGNDDEVQLAVGMYVVNPLVYVYVHNRIEDPFRLITTFLLC